MQPCLELKDRIGKAVLGEPQKSPVISGFPPGLHLIQGISAGFIPKVLDISLIDKIIPVGKREAGQAAPTWPEWRESWEGFSSAALTNAL
jgi:cysteine synthase